MTVSDAELYLFFVIFNYAAVIITAHVKDEDMIGPLSVGLFLSLVFGPLMSFVLVCLGIAEIIKYIKRKL
jgi:uncharacterized integral membrane protein